MMCLFLMLLKLKSHKEHIFDEGAIIFILKTC